MDGEVWLPWPKDDMYEVSSFGNVRSYARPGNRNGSTRRAEHHPIKQTTSVWGYKVVWIGGKYKTYLPVHRMMLEAFVGIPKEKKCGLHNNDIRTDNRIENLRWGTHKENMFDRDKNCKTALGERNGLTTLTELDVIEIRYLKNDVGATKRAIAMLFDISFASVKDILCKRTWKHV